MPKSNRGLAWVAVLTWLCAALPIAWLVPDQPELLASPRVLTALAGWLVFGACLVPALRADMSDRRSIRHAWIQLAGATLMVAALPFTARGAPTSLLLFMVLAPCLPLAGALRAGLWLVAIQTAVIWIVYQSRIDDLGTLVVFVASVFGLQCFAFFTGALVRRESDARQALEQALCELTTAQGVLNAGSRLAERTRISRELHDSLGHHLTSLSLQLEVARHRATGEARESVETARSLCRILLAELRDVLHDVRAMDASELEESLRGVLDSVQQPNSTLVVYGELGQIPPDVGHALLRCTQEIATNAMRHAHACTLTVELRRTAGRIVLRARDDGRGMDQRESGSGLAGMRARTTELGGSFKIHAADDGPGTVVELDFPLEQVVH